MTGVEPPTAFPRERGGRTLSKPGGDLESKTGGGRCRFVPHHGTWGNTIKRRLLQSGPERDSDGGAAVGASEATKGAVESKERQEEEEEREFPQH